jgi:hypothetical protein
MIRNEHDTFNPIEKQIRRLGAKSLYIIDATALTMLVHGEEVLYD